MAKEYRSVYQKMQDYVPYYIAKYLVWYFTDKDERESWEDLCKCDINFKSKDGENKTEQFAKENWLTREDSQKAIQVYMKHMRTYNLSKIYYKMLDKAMTGDTNAAKWVENFSNSDFFDETEDEINSYLDGINIPSLKGGK